MLLKRMDKRVQQKSLVRIKRIFHNDSFSEHRLSHAKKHCHPEPVFPAKDLCKLATCLSEHSETKVPYYHCRDVRNDMTRDVFWSREEQYIQSLIS